MNEHLLSAVIFLPMLGALAALFAPERAAKWICMVFALLALAASIPLATGFGKPDLPSYKQYVEQSVLPQAYTRHGLNKESQQTAALARMRAEKEENALRLRLEAELDSARRSAL